MKKTPRLSSFVIASHHGDSVLLKSILSASVIEISRAAYQAVIDGDFSGFSRAEQDDLAAMGFLVTSTVDEEFHQYGVSFSEERDNPFRLSVYFATTMACNLTCTYCFEEGVKSALKMGGAVVDKACDYIDSLIKHGSYEQLYINFFGGEPLANFPAIERAMPQLNDIARKYGLSIIFSITTNATLLTRERTDFMISHGLREAQITLDGEEAIHNTKKTYKDGRPTYQDILASSKYLFDSMPHDTEDAKGVCFRVNIEPENCETGFALMDDLLIKGFEGIRIYFSPIIEIIDNEYNSCVANNCRTMQFSDERLVSAISRLSAYALNNGFATQEVYRTGPCMDVSKDDCLIAPDGGVFKCLEMIGHPDQQTGSVLRQQTPEEALRYEVYHSLSHTRTCYESQCELLPLCNGGCRVDALIRTGDLKAQVCNRETMRRINEALLHNHYAE